MRRTIEIVNLVGSGNAGRLSANLPVPLDYIAYAPFNTDASSTPGDITQIKESLNADVVRLYDGAAQEAMNVFDKMLTFDATAAPTKGSALVIPNEMVGMLSPVAVYSTTRNCLSPDPDTEKAINSILLEWVQTSANAWRLFCVVDDAIKGGPGGIERISQHIATLGGGSENSLAERIKLSSPERRWFRRGFFSLSAGTFLNGDFRIVRDSSFAEVFKRPKLLNDQLCGDANKRVPVTTTSKYDLDTTETGMPEMFDTMDSVPKGTDASFPMGNEFVKPRIFDVRIFPSAGADLTATISSVGRL